MLHDAELLTGRTLHLFDINLSGVGFAFHSYINGDLARGKLNIQISAVSFIVKTAMHQMCKTMEVDGR